ncbi:MAG: hypothetical protein JGK38_23905 [Microcoleus sp. PH2017_15_JOR_U_A]|uniref:hypothetical protein n=1 Tax=unclassified Microcoleus TaxID=2642155 RepID=UPI001DE814D1|nr:MULTISPECIES: hypothetical protein [unclassified Microcoleus]MCC3473304.1 hypothetical protein [Microcoleus sp. PH2017_13_LAR_U_A]MCC3486530.1 hypothetical protein [Microcoleus sp. PH2017_14_LAR_D_A]MCC3499602.1 hypothetical protein [Microcoleus sp. PH2017_15_JOR_U_A]MCC3600173.1 hypothetical protein [Microcoleus sp. PH2017_26_ELK_O_A]MCC3623172.1 hypothetical protein [Microcoleus sp. PH2017_36_ELK_O_B]
MEVPIGLSPFGARGGIAIDPATGQIRGGYGGLGIGKGPIGASIDVGADTPPEGEKTGCFRYITITLGPFSHTYGDNQCEPKSSPTPTPATSNPNEFNPNNLNIESQCPDGTRWTAMILAWRWIEALPVPQGMKKLKEEFEYNVKNMNGSDFVGYRPNYPADADKRFGVNNWVMFEKKFNVTSTVGSHWLSNSGGNFDSSIVTIKQQYDYIEFFHKDYQGFGGIRGEVYNFKVFLISIKPPPRCPDGSSGNLPPPPSSPSFSPPVPNPPPKRKMDDDCCKLLIALQLETLRLLGREVGPNGLIQQTKKTGFLGEEIERVETPILDPINPKKTKIQFLTVYDLLKYALKQANNLDTALDPQSYKIPRGLLQNPKYNRDSEKSLKSNIQPSKDKAGNKRELEINKDDEVKISGFLQQQSYAFQMLRRLEYLFPFGELEDALVAKSLLIPGAEGEIRIHNMIMAYEIQMQYLDAALGNPREILTIKDANPALEGDQPIEVRSLSISDLLRQNIKFHINTGGDVDALVNLVLRDLRTNLANRIDLIKNTEMVQALFEDSGMLEDQDYIIIHLEGDPYAGQWIKGQGFKANPDLEKKTEEATEKVLRETMKPSDIKIKVSRRDKSEKTDMRDLIRGLADFMQRLLSIPSGGDAAKSIDKLIESAKFKVQTDMALLRQNVVQAASASRNRTKKRKK